MYCVNCGKEMANDWIKCPYCGSSVENVSDALSAEAENQTGNFIERQEENSTEEDMTLIKALFKNHPVRFIASCLFMLPFIGSVLAVFGLRWNEITIAIVLRYGALFCICETGMWLIYGPVNYEDVKEKVTGERAKNIKFFSHIVGVICALVILRLVG